MGTAQEFLRRPEEKKERRPTKSEECLEVREVLGTYGSEKRHLSIDDAYKYARARFPDVTHDSVARLMLTFEQSGEAVRLSSVLYKFMS